MALTGVDYTFLAVLNGVPLTLLLILLRNNTRRIDRIETRLDEVEDNKVAKRDWMRESISTRDKVDQAIERLAGIDSKLDAEFGMSAALNRVADSMSRLAEKKQ